jgi:hypothetical protein
MCRTSRKSGALTYRIPMGLCKPVVGQLYFTLYDHKIYNNSAPTERMLMKLDIELFRNSVVKIKFY